MFIISVIFIFAAVKTDNETIIIPVGEIIRNRLDELNISQTELAVRVGEHIQTISAILCGKREITIPLSVRLDQELGFTPGTLAIAQTQLLVKKELEGKQMESKQEKKLLIMEKIKNNGGFWSYSGIPEHLDDDSVIEASLVHLDLEDLPLLFGIWSKAHIKKIWKERLVSQGKRMDILNYILAVKLFKYLRHTRASQLAKGIIILVIITWLSGVFHLYIFNTILTTIMNWGVLALMIIFQPELRRGLEQLGTNQFSKLIGIDKSIEVKTKENIYRIVIAATELSKSKTGALIVIERDIKLNDIIDTGIMMDSEISPQLLVNIFVPKTPLHDGAVVISDNKIIAASCMLPLADDKDIARELGTRHRAAIGISKETDCVAVVVSEETGKISIAKEGTLIADVKEETLKKILIKYLITIKDIEQEKNAKIQRFKNLYKKNKKSEE